MSYLIYYQQFFINLFILTSIIYVFVYTNYINVFVIYTLKLQVFLNFNKKIKLKKIKHLIWLLKLQLFCKSKINLYYSLLIIYYNKKKTNNYTQTLQYKLNFLVKRNLHKKFKWKFNKLTNKLTIKTKIIFKPISMLIKNNNLISKFYIRKNKFFSKTKFSWVRQECKNIVNLTLILNAIFIIFVFNICMNWKFLIPTNFLFLILLFFVLLPICFKAPKIWNFYKNCFFISK